MTHKLLFEDNVCIARVDHRTVDRIDFIHKVTLKNFDKRNFFSIISISCCYAGATPGSFFTKYPVHRTLISINKRNTGKSNKEFNLRHDWNSLISDDESLLMTKYSKVTFFSKETMTSASSDNNYMVTFSFFIGIPNFHRFTKKICFTPLRSISLTSGMDV